MSTSADTARWRPAPTTVFRHAMVALVVALSTAVVCRVVFDIDVGARRALVVVITTAAAMLVSTLPIRAIPSAALVLVAVVPPGLFPEQLPRIVTPASIVFAGWVVRRLLARGKWTIDRPSGAAAAMMVALSAWCVVATAASVDMRVSIGWTTGVLAVIAPAVLLVSADEARLVRRTWCVLSVPLAMYLVVESFLRSNVLFGSLPGVGDPQHWSSYRSTGAFGHPLAAGTFFAVAFALLVGEALDARGRARIAAAVGAVVAFDAVLCTIARGSLIAALAGLVVVAAAVAITERDRLRRAITNIRPSMSLRTVAVGVVAAVAVWVTVDRLGAVIARATSTAAARSNGARVEGIAVALDGAGASGWLGVGPGASQRAVDAFNVTDVPIENSYLQLLLSIGIPGMVLFCALIAVAAVAATRRRDWGGLGAVVTLALSIGTYNMIDARLAYHLLIGLVLMIALNSRRPAPSPPAEPVFALPAHPPSQLRQRRKVSSKRRKKRR
ncbi:MAG: O-antigen ligase family protein [Rhodococcus sp. (in: high G+C Gram-positive bacteria)]